MAVEVETQGLLFDMDGVLISSIGSVTRCWRQWAEIHGIPDAANFNVPHGQRAIEIVRMLRPDMDARMRACRSLKTSRWRIRRTLQVLPGCSRALLEALAAGAMDDCDVVRRTALAGRQRLTAAGAAPCRAALISGGYGGRRASPMLSLTGAGAELLGFAAGGSASWWRTRRERRVRAGRRAAGSPCACRAGTLDASYGACRMRRGSCAVAGGGLGSELLWMRTCCSVTIPLARRPNDACPERIRLRSLRRKGRHCRRLRILARCL